MAMPWSWFVHSFIWWWFRWFASSFSNLFKCYEHLCISIYMDTYFFTCINTLYESIIYHVDHMTMLASFFLIISNVPFPGISLIFCTLACWAVLGPNDVFTSSCGSLPSLISSSWYSMPWTLTTSASPDCVYPAMKSHKTGAEAIVGCLL